MADNNNLGEIVIFNNEDGEVRVQIDAVNETIWLNQRGMAQLFGVTPQNITLHLKAIYRDGELVESATCKELLQVQTEGARQVKRMTKFYNLDAIIAVGYRSNAKLPMMGLTSTEKKGEVKSADTGIGKNYLTKQEIDNLKLIVDQYLSFAEAQAINHIPMKMADWEQNLNVILTMNRKNILQTKGKITMAMAKRKARLEYKVYKEGLREQEHLESLKELDEDLRKLKEKEGDKDKKEDTPE